MSLVKHRAALQNSAGALVSANGCCVCVLHFRICSAASLNQVCLAPAAGARGAAVHGRGQLHAALRRVPGGRARPEGGRGARQGHRAQQLLRVPLSVGVGLFWAGLCLSFTLIQLGPSCCLDLCNPLLKRRVEERKKAERWRRGERASGKNITSKSPATTSTAQDVQGLTVVIIRTSEDLLSPARAAAVWQLAIPARIHGAMVCSKHAGLDRQSRHRHWRQHRPRLCERLGTCAEGSTCLHHEQRRREGRQVNAEHEDNLQGV